MTAAKVAALVIGLLDALLPRIPDKHQPRALDLVEAWLKRRRATIAKHQALLDARKGRR